MWVAGAQWTAGAWAARPTSGAAAPCAAGSAAPARVAGISGVVGCPARRRLTWGRRRPRDAETAEARRWPRRAHDIPHRATFRAGVGCARARAAAARAVRLAARMSCRPTQCPTHRSTRQLSGRLRPSQPPAIRRAQFHPAAQRHARVPGRPMDPPGAVTARQSARAPARPSAERQSARAPERSAAGWTIVRALGLVPHRARRRPYSTDRVPPPGFAPKSVRLRSICPRARAEASRGK